MRGGGKQDQAVGAAGKQAGQTRTPGDAAGTAFRDVVGLVDDDDVPVGILQIGAVFGILLKRIHGDDAFVKIMERIVVGGDLLPYTVQAHRIQAGQRDGKTGPQFFLELGHHAFDRDHKDASAPAATDELGQQYAALQRFTQAHGIRDEQALPGLAQGQGRRVELIGYGIHGRLVPAIDTAIRGHGLAQQAFQIQARILEIG